MGRKLFSRVWGIAALGGRGSRRKFLGVKCWGIVGRVDLGTWFVLYNIVDS